MLPPTPPAIHCRHFSSSPMCRALPAKPNVSPYSAIWVAEQSQPGRPLAFARLGLVGDAGPRDRDDNSLPLYRDAGSSSIPHVVRCGGTSYSASVCGKTHVAGVSVRIPPGAFPAGNDDHHLSVEDDSAGAEFDFYGAAQPTAEPGSPLDAIAGGRCPYDGDGTACSGSTATNIATSLGAIDPTIVRAVESNPHGTLPAAIATALLCASPTWVYPADYSDGANTNPTPACRDHVGPNGRPPEGTRFFLDISDADVDATANPPYAKVLLRTLDREHFGGTVTDTNWSGAPGPAVQFLRDGWGPILSEAGLPSNARGLPFPSDGIDLAQKLKFCTNGTC